MQHTHHLREVSKFLAGLVFGDLLFGIWLATSSMQPPTVFGVLFSMNAVWLGVALDVVFLLLLVHYAWHPKVMEPTMAQRTFFVVMGLITAFVAAVHATRLALGWSVVIAGWQAPQWISWAGVLLAGYLSYVSFHLAARNTIRARS